MYALLYLLSLILSISMLLALWVAAIWLQFAIGIVIHELGHLVAGKVLGVKSRIFYINTHKLIGDRIIWCRNNGTLYIFHNKIEDSLGFVWMDISKNPVINLIISLAGPGTNIGWVLCTVIIYFALNLSGDLDYTVFFYIVLTSLVQILLIVASLFGSDGSNIKKAVLDIYQTNQTPR